MSRCEINLERPEGFDPCMHVVAGFVMRGGEMLLLLRNEEKDEGGKWGLPAGKVDEGESRSDALLREVFEETGIEKGRLKIYRELETFVRYPDYDFVFHMHEVHVDSESVVTISDQEHQDFIWVTPEKALEMNLVMGNKECMELFFA